MQNKKNYMRYNLNIVDSSDRILNYAEGYDKTVIEYIDIGGNVGKHSNGHGGRLKTLFETSSLYYLI